MIKVISFDVDGTLVDHGFVDLVWNDGMPRLYSEQTGMPLEEAKEYLRERYDEIGEGDIRWYLPDYWFEDLNLRGRPEELIRQYSHEVRIFPEVKEVLEGLSKRFDLIACTNASREFLDVSLDDLYKYFQYTFSSTTDFGLVRKTPEFYEYICEILEIKPQEMVHVGDHERFDYLVPKEFGIRAFYLDRSGKRKGDFVIKDLRELLERFNEEPLGR
jgi:putative hydrolase of the HAD superfamily